MIEVAPRLYVGNQLDYLTQVRGKDDNPKPGWQVVQACKEPFHREALGYKGRAAPRDHAEYLWANRENRLILNMVDVPDPAYIRPEMIDNALDFIEHALDFDGFKVLIHCNQGGSRAPGIALLYLRRSHQKDPERFWGEGRGFLGQSPYDDGVERCFRDIYPSYTPAGGIRGYLIAHWDDQPKQV